MPAEHRAVVLFGVLHQPRVLLGVEELVSGDPSIASRVFSRSPAQFLSRYWRPGVMGAIRLGLLHGAYCVGCCWMLMALLFVGGVMNFAWIAALTLLVGVEKLVPGGEWVGRAAGVALIAWGAARLLA